MKHTVELSNPTSPGAKLGSRIEPRSLKNNDDEKTMEHTRVMKHTADETHALVVSKHARKTRTCMFACALSYECVCFIARVFHRPCVFLCEAPCSPWFYCSPLRLNDGSGSRCTATPLVLLQPPQAEERPWGPMQPLVLLQPHCSGTEERPCVPLHIHTAAVLA